MTSFVECAGDGELQEPWNDDLSTVTGGKDKEGAASMKLGKVWGMIYKAKHIGFLQGFA